MNIRYTAENSLLMLIAVSKQIGYKVTRLCINLTEDRIIRKIFSFGVINNITKENNSYLI